MFNFINKNKFKNVYEIFEHEDGLREYSDPKNNINCYKCENFEIDFYHHKSQNKIYVFLTPIDFTYNYARLLNSLKTKINKNIIYYMVISPALDTVYLGETEKKKQEACIFSKALIDFILNNIDRILKTRICLLEVLSKVENIMDVGFYIEKLIYEITIKYPEKIDPIDLQKIIWIDILAIFYVKILKKPVYPSEYQVILEFKFEDIMKHFFSK